MRRLDVTLVCVAILCLGGSVSAQVLPTCSGSETYRFKVQGSIDNGYSYQDGSAWVYVYPGYSVNVKARTLMTVTSGQTQGWSFGLEHYTPYWSGVTLLSATTSGTQAATCQNGNPPDYNDTAPVAGYNGYTSAIVIDNNSVHKLNPVTNFTTSAACYQIQAPSMPGTYYLTLRFTHDIGTPKVWSILSQNGADSTPCGYTFTFNIYVSNSVQPTPSAYCPGGGMGPMGGEGQLGPEGGEGPLGPEGGGQPPVNSCFRRGFTNNDAVLNIADPVFSLNFLFAGGTASNCHDAVDANDDGRMTLTDPVFTLNHLFQGGNAPPAPFAQCGQDPTADSLDCISVSSSVCLDGDNDGLSNCHELILLTDPTKEDTDNDSFTDGEEVLPSGVEGFNIAKSPWSANPRRPDIFVEIDWFEYNGALRPHHSHKPLAASLGKVVDAFSAAPVQVVVNQQIVSNGITLHLDIGDFGVDSGGNAIVWQDQVHPGLPVRFREEYLSPNLSDECLWCREFHDIKTNPSFGKFDPMRSKVFHYALFCHFLRNAQEPGGGITQWIPHENFAVHLGHPFFSEYDANADGELNDSDKIMIESGIFMHELGHNLGLFHSGFLETLPNNNELQCKPNYDSIMNYRYTIRGVDGNCDWIPSRSILDYSRSELPELDERDLVEQTGICGNVAVDWNVDGDTNDPAPGQTLERDVDHDEDLNDGSVRCRANGVFTPMHGFDDWAHVRALGMGNPRRLIDGQFDAMTFCPSLGSCMGGGGGSIPDRAPCLMPE